MPRRAPHAERSGACSTAGACADQELTALVFADMSELSLPSNCSMNFPEGKDKLMHFEITIRPEEGYYRWVKQACRSWQQVAAA